MVVDLYGYDLDPVIFNTRTKTRIKQLVSGYSVRLFARNTVIKKATKQADKKRARDFLNEYHVQGASRASVYYLVYNDSNLVAVASFDMNNRNFESELKRLCVKPIDRFVETELSHRTDDKKGYDRIYTAGSKLWLFKR